MTILGCVGGGLLYWDTPAQETTILGVVYTWNYGSPFRGDHAQMALRNGGC